MKVFKFGGASLKSGSAIRNVASIVRDRPNQLLVVVSAIGKTTDALEKIIALSQSGQPFIGEVNQIRDHHFQIIADLFTDSKKVVEEVSALFEQVSTNAALKGDYDFVYDQVIGFGEIISSVIVHHYFLQEGLACDWIDARKYIVTNDAFREGQVLWPETEKKVKTLEAKLKKKIMITQGFIGSNARGETVSLGREGSDFTAAIFGSSLIAESVTIWKDVPGVMSADPRRLPGAVVFEELPYKETAEMTYYGASVIHPKTVKPLANKNIPLLVKSFVDPSLEGTKIHECRVDRLPPLIVHKENQCLISCKVTDYSFINEEQLGKIFQAISASGVRINMMQNSAISFSFCVDYRESKVLKLIETLSKSFEVYYNSGLTLITIKNYDAKTFEEYRSLKGLILEQSSRAALQVLVRDFK
ncbi:MAG TPA: aspartate kinase [Cyclobacteriaceae bacterium]|jgi:aspartate kinase|nr:aspartate kinase [Cyclobacteriaceae bacterium]